MSNFNYLRISNLNYNNNTSRIDDQIFFLNGENTMLNLRNGGGKTVIIQMMMAPFVRRKYRDLNERRFDSYFTSKSPTYILVEWNLEDGAGYLLTGMMVRKKESSSDDDSRDKLDIINFVYEYKSRNKYDIKSIPIIESDGKSKKIKSFINSKKLFEELKKNNDYDFNYYDMNNYVASKAYFDKLREYGIDNKEWENIIKKVNLTESGLSQLFKEAKNTEGLVKKWFLPIVEEKLNKDEDRIDNYRDIIEKYIIQYKINKSNIDRKNKIEIFNEQSKEIKEAALNFKKQVEMQENHKNKIANYYKALYEVSESRKNAISIIDESLLKNEQDIKEIQYEETSLKIYSHIDNISEIEKELDKIIIFKEEYEKELSKLNKEKNILNCADVYERYTKYSKKLQEIEIKINTLKSEEEDKAPEINNLGYSIRKLLKEDLARKKSEISKFENEKINFEKVKEELEEEIPKNQKLLNNICVEEGSLLEKIKLFDNFEERFNRNYNEKFKRNIIGYFDDKEKLMLGLNITSSKKKFEDDKKKIEGNIIKNEQLLKSKISERENINGKSAELKANLNTVKEKIKVFNDELNIRKDVVRYINFDENKIWYEEEIIREYNKKVSIINSELQELYKIKDNIQKEIDKFRNGRIVEIPKEFLESLKNNDIEIIYGMEWLKKNQYSLKENEELVENNPFIPYSLIMDKRDIGILQKSSIDIFTSFPIPIIEREDLESKIKKGADGLVIFEGIKFYVSFNSKLLDESELKKILENKEEEKNNILKKIEEKEEAFNLYNDKRSYIKNSNLTKEIYETALADLGTIEKAINDSKNNILFISKEIAEIEEELKEDSDKKDSLKYSINELEKKEQEYKELIIQYDKYCEDKEKYDDVIEQKKVYELKIDKEKRKLRNISYHLEDIKEKIHGLNDRILECSNELKSFEDYKEGEFKEKDLEDLLAEYKVITREIYGNIAELESERKEALNEYSKIEKQLISKESEFGLMEEEFRNVVYDFSKETSIIKEIEVKENKIRKMEKEISGFEKDKAIEETKIESLKEELKRIANTDVPKEKSEIYNKNFEEELAKLKINQDNLKIKKENCENEIKLIDINRSSLDEYEFTIKEEIEINISLDNLDIEVKKIKRDYNIFKNKIHESEKNVYDLITKISNEDMFKNDSLFKDAILGLIKVCDNPINLLNQLSIVLDSYNMIVEKLMHDIEIIAKEERNILNNLYEYISLVNENIEKIDENSTINISGKSVKMLKISAVNIEENKELYSIRIKEYIESIRDYCVNLLESNESIKEYIEKSINIIKLYDEIVSIGNINIKLYKIEENKQKQITWDEVAKNSGGEGFLSAFVILSSLLSYMRKEDRDIFTRKEVSKVLIMDNPFAQTNAEHLLKPLIEISKKSKTQLICLTGLGGDSIINRFDNIYVLNLVSSKLKNGLKVIKAEHVIGDEEVETIISSNIKTEEVQMRLF